MAHYRPLFIYLCRCHATLRTGRGQVVQDMAGERGRSRDEDVCRFNSVQFENCADGFTLIVITLRCGSSVDIVLVCSTLSKG